MLKTIINWFPLWAILGSAAAYVQPDIFVPLKSQIVPLLMIIMLSMGLTLRIADFKRLSLYLKAVGVGVFLQFSIMPLAALLIAMAFGMNEALTIGMVLVGSVAGGTASNVICYLAKGNVALSITMTAISTLLGVVMTPFLVDLFLGVSVDVPVMQMVMSLVKIVLIPVSIGVFVNHFFSKAIERVNPVLPLISMAAIVLAIAIIVALNRDQIANIGAWVFFAVVLHNSIGLIAGYGLCRVLGFDKTICKTIAIEVGLQNSGLATALALKFFTPLSALPAGIFSIWHNLSGSVLAYFWSKEEDKDKPFQEQKSL
ncbi:putative Bile acid:sodium symporter [Vibrio nigripulchritudo SO65]|uniref:bile acid:sodium symporter family protein n=1 Tax=Vibrio nigripulchritudo TaxID=28173 RepID=UPI0003B19260|nr:bile acid:sodium symporter family protein [Vibrio nigripulchritudo]CCN34263.1 putative Bile acid:sodium symporter [Vibrio nigripulchritudo AM115]CCN44057.1 putative Bile acid:sodium symporter [Vibrio nigripulchritudo FTn2]CCN64255.1 putative Bile acid:sodium symporter [Vibrio nigripulchritudo POn4]CCN79030.1 putative Bile acid:sodium symporter [Vibrio nigripulchritudo SO65]